MTKAVEAQMIGGGGRDPVRAFRLSDETWDQVQLIRADLRTKVPPGLAKGVSLSDAVRYSIAAMAAQITGTGAGTIPPLAGAATGHVGTAASAKTPPAEAEPQKPLRRSRPRKTG